MQCCLNCSCLECRIELIGGKDPYRVALQMWSLWEMLSFAEQMGIGVGHTCGSHGVNVLAQL